MRLFVAIDLPDPLQDAIARLQLPIPHLKWTAPERLHITLQFLGEQPEPRLEAIFNALDDIRFSPMPLRCEGIGQFASGVIWLGIDPQPALMQLHRQIGLRLACEGVKLEAQRFMPHITLGRCPANRLSSVFGHVLARFEGQAFSFDCDTFCLKSSLLRPRGPLHRVEALYASSGC